RLSLQLAERFFSVLDDDVGYGPARGALDVGVGVAQRDAEPLGQERADRRLPRTGRPDEDGERAAHRISMWSRYPVTLRRVSATLSPPIFSATASASTRATMASATMPAAGTAQTSERWWWARAGSPVVTSTVPRARGTVAMGFIAARTRSSSPVDRPPSVPPERPEARRMPSGVGVISSWAWEPGTRASWKPSPTSTPLMAWM